MKNAYVEALEPLITAFLAERESELQAQLHRALGEGAKVRAELLHLVAHCEEMDWPDRKLARARAALTSSPLSEAAGMVLEAAIRHREAELALRARINVPDEEQPTQEEFGVLTAERLSAVVSEDLAVDALLAELGRGGEGG